MLEARISFEAQGRNREVQLANKRYNNNLLPSVSEYYVTTVIRYARPSPHFSTKTLLLQELCRTAG